jgi:hypothetical protein
MVKGEKMKFEHMCNLDQVRQSAATRKALDDVLEKTKATFTTRRKEEL